MLIFRLGSFYAEKINYTHECNLAEDGAGGEEEEAGAGAEAGTVAGLACVVLRHECAEAGRH